MSYEERLNRRKNGRIIRIIILFFVIIFLIFGLSKFLLQQPDHPKIISAVEVVSEKSQIPSPYPTHLVASVSSSLAEAVNSALVGTHGNYGVIVENLKTGEAYLQNEHKVYKSGSLYKLWVMGEVFEKIKDGSLSEDQTLTDTVENINKRFDIDPENAERTEGTVTFSVKDALNQMITISDNYAALLLTLKIRLSSVASYLSDQGFKESKVGTNGAAPTTTPADIVTYFEKLYRGQLADATYTKKMTDLLKAQRLNDKIPKYLPDNIVIAHKTGELDEVTHDAGIVYSPSGDYIIVVMSESDDPERAKERVADVSEAVYKYFNN